MDNAAAIERDLVRTLSKADEDLWRVLGRLNEVETFTQAEIIRNMALSVIEAGLNILKATV